MLPVIAIACLLLDNNKRLVLAVRLSKALYKRPLLLLLLSYLSVSDFSQRRDFRGSRALATFSEQLFSHQNETHGFQ